MVVFHERILALIGGAASVVGMYGFLHYTTYRLANKLRKASGNMSGPSVPSVSLTPWIKFPLEVGLSLTYNDIHCFMSQPHIQCICLVLQVL